MDELFSGRAGFVLVGGASSRMYRDKALLPYRGRTLVEWVADAMARGAGSVALVGPPERYGHLGYPVIRDLAPGAGPLGGICSALRSSTAGWNAVAACDMPRLDAAFIAALLDEAERRGGDCLIPEGPSGRPEPLCAAYHARCLPALTAALARGVRRVMEAVADLGARAWRVPDPSVFENCNTPGEWAVHNDQTRREPL